MEYVAGFLFDLSRNVVALVRKNKPAWQAGKLNAIGGKIEHGETPKEAQRREFFEETGLDIDTWKMFCTLTTRDRDGAEVMHSIYFFVAFAKEWSTMRSLCSRTTEDIVVEGIRNVNSVNAIPNLEWLIPMALNMGAEEALWFRVTEFYVPNWK